MIDDAENRIRDRPETSQNPGPRPLPWWATMPLESIFPPPPQPTSVTSNVPVPRRQQKVRRKQGPGRPSVMTDEMIKEAQRMYATGEYSAAEIAEEFGVSRSTIFRHL